MADKPLHLLTSLALLGGISTDPALWPILLKGGLDKDLASLFFYKVHGSYPQDLDQALGDKGVIECLDDLKALIRRRAQAAFDSLSATPARYGVHKNSHARRESGLTPAEKERLKGFNKPDPQGTVKEIAARHNVPLALVRKLKSEGRLHELEGKPNGLD